MYPKLLYNISVLKRYFCCCTSGATIMIENNGNSIYIDDNVRISVTQKNAS
jgi:hypothetical protein